MVIKIEGKEHRQGVSKRGNEYDFYVLHFLGVRSGVEGKAAYEKLVDPSVLPYDEILVNQCYDIETDFSGSIVKMRVAKS